MEIFQWYNLIFELPFIAAIIYTLIMAMGIGGDHDSDVDADVETDLHFAVETDIDHDIGIEHSVEVHGHHEMETYNESGSFVKAMTFLGFGKVPISLLATSAFTLWGFTGWAANQILGDFGMPPLLFIWISIAIGILSALFGTRFLAKGISCVMPSTETYATREEELIGAVGEAVYAISGMSGRVQVRDRYKNLFEVPCRVAKGAKQIEAGSRVVLMNYDNDNQVFVVRIDPLADVGLLTKGQKALERKVS